MSRRETIRAERVTLVPLDAVAAAELVAGRGGGLQTARGWPHADTLDAVRAGLATGDADALPWLVLLTDDAMAPGEPLVVGDLGWKGTPSPDGRVEIGYGIAAPYRRKGLATAAVAAFVDWLEARSDVRCVDAEVHADNVASRRLLERLGFTIEVVEGGYVWYGRSRPDPG